MNGGSTEVVNSLEVRESVSYGTLNKRVYPFVKRGLDLILSLFALILFSPIFLILAIIIKIDSRGPIFYKHKRIGKNGEEIYLYKFRTMHVDAKERLAELLKDPKIKKEWEANFKLENDPRITKVGKVLRCLSVDELPQLINILNGDMSIVGPRPVIEEEIDKYQDQKAKFLSVTPGLTGWWACNGRSCTSYEERIQLELYYVDHQSLKLDATVIAKTVLAVLKRDGAK